MRISSLLSEDGILLKSKPKSKEEVINTLVECHFRLGNLNDKDSFRKAVLEREASTSTGIGGGMAIPHAMTEAVKRPAITAMTVEDGVDFKSLDGKPVNLLFMIAMPNDGKQHMNLLSHLATLMMDKSLLPSLTAVETPAEFIDFIDKLEDKLFPDEASEKPEPLEENKGYKILAVTACPMGISHTYMAAEALEKTAKEMHYSIKVETNGSAGAANVLTDEEIEKAEVIIIAADKNVDMERFNGKRVFITSVTDGLRKPKETIKAALSNKELYKYKGDTSGSEYISKPSIPMHETIAHKCYKHLMSGVSYMLPFAIGGGILHALSYFLDMIMLGNSALDFGVFGTGTQVSAFLNTLGEYAFQCMIPIFSGYIAMSIADRPGLAIGAVGGLMANIGMTFTNPQGGVPSGFIGALFAGFFAGIFMWFLERLCSHIPKSIAGIKSVLIYPVAGMIVIGFVMGAINPFASLLNEYLMYDLNMLDGNAIITLVLYYGESLWDGPTCLSDMMISMSDNIKEYFSDYKLNLVQILDSDKYSFYNEDVKDVFYIARSIYNKDIDAILNKYKTRNVDNEVMKLISVLTATPQIMNLCKSNKQGGKVNMCKAMEELKAEWQSDANKKAIISMLEFGITREQILTRYTKEDLEKAEAAIANNN